MSYGEMKVSYGRVPGIIIAVPAIIVLIYVRTDVTTQDSVVGVQYEDE